MENRELVEKLKAYLNCPCQYFPPMDDPSPIMTAYQEARRRVGKAKRGLFFQRKSQPESFLPMLIAVEDTLYEALTWESPEDREKNRQKLLAEPVRDGGEYFAQLIARRKEEYGEDGWDWPGEDTIGEMEGGEAIDRFLGISQYRGGTIPLLLAEIPVKNPWEVFAYLPFGGWNECPACGEQMIAAKYWYGKYGAVPAVMTADILEYDLPAPVPSGEAMDLAMEQYAFCGDIVDQGCGTVGALADTLAQSTKWYFWWD